MFITACGNPELYDIIRENSRIIRCHFALLDRVLPHAQLLVCHGGQLTIFKALLHSVPVLVMSLQPEQQHNGLCLKRIGCGSRLIMPEPFSGDTEVYLKALNQLSYDDIAVCKVNLPGHNNINQNPVFDARSFIGAIAEAVEKYHRENRKIVLIGHSTGGSLLLSFLAEFKFIPQGVVLLSPPHRITGEYLSRWEHHYKGNKIPLADIARQVSLVTYISHFLEHHRGHFFSFSSMVSGTDTAGT